MRAENDYYPTPPYATEQLLKHEKFYGEIWEPACGEGHISKVLEAAGYTVLSSDLIDRGYGTGGIDFQEGWRGNKIVKDNIITNPPYSDAQSFVEQAKYVAKHKIAMLLRTAFLESQERYEFFQDKVFPLKCIHQFSKRLTIHKDGVDKKGGMAAYAWFVWDKDYVGNPYISWIK
jgi:hypothetical protein